MTALSDAINLARAGRSVIYLAPTQVIARHEFNLAVTNLDTDDSVTVSRSNGTESFRYDNGGRIRFMTPLAIRGCSADIIYIDQATSQDDDTMATVLPALATRHSACITVYS